MYLSKYFSQEQNVWPKVNFFNWLNSVFFPLPDMSYQD